MLLSSTQKLVLSGTIQESQIPDQAAQTDLDFLQSALLIREDLDESAHLCTQVFVNEYNSARSLHYFRE